MAQESNDGITYLMAFKQANGAAPENAGSSPHADGASEFRGVNKRRSQRGKRGPPAADAHPDYSPRRHYGTWSPFYCAGKCATGRHPDITNPQAAIHALIDFFESRQMLMREDFVGLKKSQSRT
jgi:hypothetical protein